MPNTNIRSICALVGFAVVLVITLITYTPASPQPTPGAYLFSPRVVYLDTGDPGAYLDEICPQGVASTRFGPLGGWLTCKQNAVISNDMKQVWQRKEERIHEEKMHDIRSWR